VLARDIPNAKTVRMQTAHLSNLEQPRTFFAAVLDFLLAEKTKAGLGQETMDQ
jgi:hypothetical protein